jgi:hypothetical protein
MGFSFFEFFGFVRFAFFLDLSDFLFHLSDFLVLFLFVSKKK